MHFTWIDYPAQYENDIETWCNDPNIHFALDDESFKAEHQWYLDTGNYVFDKNYFCKVILNESTPVAVLMLVIFSEEAKLYIPENIVYLDTLIINPVLRNQGYGAKVITELIQHADQLIGSNTNIYVGQIHKDNDISIKLARKLCFHYIHTDYEINDDWFDWIYPASAADRHIAHRDNYKLRSS